MSNLKIENKDIHSMSELNFQSVGPYTDENQTEVMEPWQGRDILNNEERDGRFSLGTYTENNRGFWEENIELTQFDNPNIRNTATSSMVVHSDYNQIFGDDKIFPIPLAQSFSVDTFPFKVVDDKSYPMFFYYDKDLNKEEYSATTEGKVNLKITLRELGRPNEMTGSDGQTAPTYFNPFLDRLTLEPPPPPPDPDPPTPPTGSGDVNGGDVNLTIYASPDSYGYVNEQSLTLTHQNEQLGDGVDLEAIPNEMTDSWIYSFVEWEVVSGEEYVGFGPNKTNVVVSPTPTIYWTNGGNPNAQNASIRAIFDRQQNTTGGTSGDDGDTGNPGNPGNPGSGGKRPGGGGSEYEEEDDASNPIVIIG